MKYIIMVHAEPEIMEDERRIRELGDELFYEMLDDTAELDARWRRSGDPDARLFGAEDFEYGNLLMAGEVWPHQLPESLPFLGGIIIDDHEGIATMAMRSGPVKATSVYLEGMDLDELERRNGRFFSDDSYLTVEGKLTIARRAVTDLREFYGLAAQGGKAVVQVGSVV